MHSFAYSACEYSIFLYTHVGFVLLVKYMGTKTIYQPFLWMTCVCWNHRNSIGVVNLKTLLLQVRAYTYRGYYKVARKYEYYFRVFLSYDQKSEQANREHINPAGKHTRFSCVTYFDIFTSGYTENTSVLVTFGIDEKYGK